MKIGMKIRESIIICYFVMEIMIYLIVGIFWTFATYCGFAVQILRTDSGKCCIGNADRPLMNSAGSNETLGPYGFRPMISIDLEESEYKLEKIEEGDKVKFKLVLKE